MTLSILLILVGFALLIFGGEILLRGAVNLATFLKLTPAVIGLTVVAIGTSVPELAVSLLSALQNKADITVGNAVGSNIFNICGVLGISAIASPLLVSGNTIKLEYPVMFLVALIYLAVAQDGNINWLDSVTFLTIYVCFTAYLISIVKNQVNRTEDSEFKTEVEEISGKNNSRRNLLSSVIYLIIGSILLGVGAKIAVSGAVDIATIFGLSERVIGLTIISIGTSLPEVVTSVVSSIRGRNDIAIANVIGSNIFNILGILGITALISPLPVNILTISSDNWWMLIISLLLFPMLFSGRKINRIEGIILVFIYVIYLYKLIFLDI